ncbi:MAG: hypothetical protein V5A29_03215 [Haloarculaceae archaeon]
MRDSDEQNPQLGPEIRTVVERQLRISELEAPNQALERLMDRGHTREQAIDTTGTVLLEEMHEMMAETELFDRERYVERLQEL